MSDRFEDICEEIKSLREIQRRMQEDLQEIESQIEELNAEAEEYL